MRLLVDDSKLDLMLSWSSFAVIKMISTRAYVYGRSFFAENFTMNRDANPDCTNANGRTAQGTNDYLAQPRGPYHDLYLRLWINHCVCVSISHSVTVVWALRLYRHRFLVSFQLWYSVPPPNMDKHNPWCIGSGCPPSRWQALWYVPSIVSLPWISHPLHWGALWQPYRAIWPDMKDDNVAPKRYWSCLINR